jgi:hypothetical protein
LGAYHELATSKNQPVFDSSAGRHFVYSAADLSLICPKDDQNGSQG